jgi:tetratricopeptide (TPR) repeat protein
MGRGNSHRLKGEYDQALPDLDKSIALKPDYAESHYDRRARIFHRQKAFDSALADLNHAQQEQPTWLIERAHIYFFDLDGAAQAADDFAAAARQAASFLTTLSPTSQMRPTSRKSASRPIPLPTICCCGRTMRGCMPGRTIVARWPSSPTHWRSRSGNFCS